MFDPKKLLKEEEAKKEKSEPKKKLSTPNRRDFLRGVAMGAGAVALSPILSKKAEAVDIDVFPMKAALRGENVVGGRLVHDYRKCAGCQVCEVTCSIKNDGEVNPSKSRIKIYTFQPTVFIGIACQQCGDRPCVNACPVEPDKEGRRALYVDPKTKSLALNKERCTNCESCVEACEEERNGNLRMNKEELPEGYCVLCGECVKQCPQNALMFVPRTTDGRYAAKKADFLAKEAIDTLYGGPKTIVDNWK